VVVHTLARAAQIFCSSAVEEKEGSMPEVDPADRLAAANPLRIHNPALIPAARYYDEAFHQLECERLWPNVWQMACRLEQIPNIGDWVEYSNLGKSVIVVRTKDGVKAFENHCRHRGVPIAGGQGAEHGNCATSGFICPFHGWRWNMDGECTFVYGRHLFDQDLLEPEELALRTVRVETWGGCAFINHSPDALSLRESLGPLLDRLEAHGVDDLRVEWWCGTVLPANWKTAMEAFMEGYHVLKTHPQLPEVNSTLYAGLYGPGQSGAASGIVQKASYADGMTTRGAIDAQVAHMEQLNQGMAGLCQAKEIEIAKSLRDAELPEDPAEAVPMWYAMVQDKISKELRARGESVPDLNAVCVSDPIQSVEFLFPNHFLLSFMTSSASYRIRPLTPETCLFEIWSLTHFSKGQDPAPPQQPKMLPYDSDDFPLIPRQDYSNIPIQQKGFHSEGFEYLRLSKDVEGLISNYQRVIDGYIDGEAPEKLASATHKLAGNFDGRILDLELE
jgi:nitrite reductase/ring-hydroxylating ferredoxin subunit